jgi:hypothetical protein
MQEAETRKLMTPRLIVLLCVLAVGIVVALYIHLVYVPYMRDLWDDYLGFVFEELNLDGDGTPANPFRLSTPEDLAELAEKVNAGSSYFENYFVLMNDIDMTAYLSPGGAGYNNGAGWMPIGAGFSFFSGILDGADYTISGLWLDRPEDFGGGLFGQLTDAEIYRLNVKATSITARWGAALAVHVNNTVIQHCSASVDEFHSSYGFSSVFGMIAGRVDSGSLIYGSYAAGSVDISINDTNDIRHLYAGGLIGIALDSVIRNCHADVEMNVTAPDMVAYIGGFIGSAWDGTSVINCRSAGSVIINGDDDSRSYIGGFAGESSGNIASSFATANITAEVSWGYTGGFVGSQGGGEVLNSFATGTVIGQDYNTGGFAGIQYSEGRIINCYYAGIITTGWRERGFVDSQRGTIRGSYFDAELSGTEVAGRTNDTAVGEAIGKTTAEMQNRETFEGWDFAGTWRMPESGGYPQLAFMF